MDEQTVTVNPDPTTGGSAVHFALPNGEGISVSLFQSEPGRAILRIESDRMDVETNEVTDRSHVFLVDYQEDEKAPFVEAVCGTCGETFLPADCLDYVHGMRDGGSVECGGIGRPSGERRFV
jgi:hypothetical protein